MHFILCSRLLLFLLYRQFTSHSDPPDNPLFSQSFLFLLLTLPWDLTISALLSFQASLPSAMKAIFSLFFPFCLPNLCNNTILQKFAPLQQSLCQTSGKETSLWLCHDFAGSQPPQSATQPHSSDTAGSPLSALLPCTQLHALHRHHRQPADCGCQATCTLLLHTDPTDMQTNHRVPS